jgi:hypothetical protein
MVSKREETNLQIAYTKLRVVVRQFSNVSVSNEPHVQLWSHKSLTW